MVRSLGALGGGNHFIEVDKGNDGTYYLVLHTGNRNLGKQVADYYQKLAVGLHRGKEDYFSANLEKALFCEFSWILSLSMFCTGFSNFHKIINL